MGRNTREEVKETGKVKELKYHNNDGTVQKYEKNVSQKKKKQSSNNKKSEKKSIMVCFKPIQY
jgi:hypothetical protein